MMVVWIGEKALGWWQAARLGGWCIVKAELL